MPVAVSDYRSLISGFNWNGSQINGQPIVLTYSFAQTAPYYLAAERPEYVSTYAPMNDMEKAAVRDAMAQWSSVSGVTFIESPNRIGDLNFAVANFTSVGMDPKFGGLGNYPARSDYLAPDGTLLGASDYRAGGDVLFNITHRADSWYQSGLINLALHEIGHALGLKHPHDVTEGHDEVLSPDPDGATVMSYQYQPKVLGAIDIAAVQYLYGQKGAPADWVLDASKERFTFTGTSTGETIRGTAWDDVIYANGGRDIVAASMGNDQIHIENGEAFVAGDDGVDIVWSAAKSGGERGFYADGVWSYLNLGSTRQTFNSVEFIVASDGVYNTATKAFVSRDIYDKFGKAYAILASSEPAHAQIETEATSRKDVRTFVAELLGGAAKDASLPAVSVYQKMMGAAPGAEHAKILAAFVHDQIFSPGYQATANPRLGGYEAMGLALADSSAVISTNIGKSDTEFVTLAYRDLFGRDATSAQAQHFVGQVDYFEALYRGVGMSEASANLKARGAAYGQMLGYAVDAPGNALAHDAEQALLGYLKAAGVGDWLV